ncbi:hypothetical protein D9M68_969590 [compost metagenome]
MDQLHQLVSVQDAVGVIQQDTQQPVFGARQRCGNAIRTRQHTGGGIQAAPGEEQAALGVGLKVVWQ